MKTSKKKRSFHPVLGVLLFLISIYPASLQAKLPGDLKVGLGMGLDFGGFGGNVSYQPVKMIGLFGGAGYNLDAIGYNAGIRSFILSKKNIGVYLTGMYGYNAVLQVEGLIKSKTTYYGPTIGGGIFWSAPNNGPYSLNAGLLIPFRVHEFGDAIDALKLAGYEVGDPLPIGISLGIHVRLNKK